MIQPTNCNGLSSNRTSTGVEIQNKNVKMSENKQKNKILEIYNSHLSLASPTYSRDIKEIMKNANIEDNNLNAEIVKTLDQQGIAVSKQALDVVTDQLQRDDIFKLYEQGYDIETLTIDIIAKKLTQSEEKLYSSSEDSQKNVAEKISKYKEKVEAILDRDNAMIENMIRSNLDITINNLYTAKHSGVPKNSNASLTEEQIIAVLGANGIKVTQETMNAARRLIGSNIDIDKGKVEKYIKIENLLNHIDIDSLLVEATKEMKKGKNPGDVELRDEKGNDFSKLTNEEVHQIVKDIHNFDDQVIEDTYKNNQNITIENLQKTLYENTEKVLHKKEEKVESVDAQQVSITKRQLEELRLKLTVEAALKLNNKIDIQTADLEEVVQELKMLEQEENIEHMESISKRIYTISKNKELAAVGVIEQAAEFTLKGMDEAIQVKLAQETYNTVGTKPERRFGESIIKVEDQIQHILTMQNIEPTTQNIKAAKALVENSIDITAQKVEDVKIVMAKIETVLYELRPAMVAQLLKEGVQPDTLHIDHLIGCIHYLKEELGQDPMQNIAEAILELDSTNQLSMEEKEGLIAVYRMLKTITTRETQAIGFLLKNDRELTLGNLFEASKYIKQIGSKNGKMDVVVDNALGALEGSDTTMNIRSLIKQAVQSSPSSFQIEKIMNQTKGLENISSNTLKFLKEQNIPLTISNIYMADKIIKNPFLLGDMLREYETVTGEKLQSPVNNHNQQNGENILEQLQEELKEQVPIQLSATQSTKAYVIGKELDQMCQMQKHIINNDGIYQIPVVLHYGLSNLNIYVMNEKEQSSSLQKEELRAYMSMKTKNLGIIQVHIHIQDHALSFEMIGETAYITTQLQKDSNGLKKAIETIGYNVLGTKFSQEEFINPSSDLSKSIAPLLKDKFSDSKFEYIV